MSGELRIKLASSGLTIKACLANKAGLVWSGSAFVAWSSLANTAAWQAGLIACTEQALADATATGFYVGDLPAGVAVPVSVIFFSGASPSPSDVPYGIQDLSDVDLFTSTGLVVANGSNSATSFKTDLTGTDEDNYVGRLLVLLTGNGAREPRRITGFDTGTKFITLSVALSDTPTSGAAFTILGMIEA